MVDEKLDAVALHYFVAGTFFVQRHLVMQPRATAFHNLHAQPFAGGLCLFVEQMAKLSHCALGDVDHIQKYGSATG